MSDVSKKTIDIGTSITSMDEGIKPFNEKIFSTNYSSKFLNENHLNNNLSKKNLQSLSLNAPHIDLRDYFPTKSVFGSFDNLKPILSNSNSALHSSMSFGNQEINKNTYFFLPPKTVTTYPIPVESNSIFCCVPGRLTLLGLTTRYKITVGEILRRLSHPEFLNTSLLGAILRKSKNKNGGTKLRESLSRIKIKLPIGRRKAYGTTSFTSFTESESLKLANDFKDISRETFPCSLFGKAIVDSEINQNRNPKIIEEILKNSIMLIKIIKNILLKDRSPITTTNESPILKEFLQEPLKRFSLLTHGFGTMTLITSLNILEKIFTEGLHYLEFKYQHLNLQNLPICNFQNNNLSNLSSQIFKNNHF